MIFCRCHPKQKARIAEILVELTKKRVACIGDGGNDVAMIQVANLGIGIQGKEGNQAAMAADYSIPEFKTLQNLILWHGRLAYRRSSSLAQFVIHRGLIISFIQMFFFLTFHYVAISIYNGWLLLGYSTFFTSLPIFCIVDLLFHCLNCLDI